MRKTFFNYLGKKVTEMLIYFIHQLSQTLSSLNCGGDFVHSPFLPAAPFFGSNHYCLNPFQGKEVINKKLY
jgi:hypothetical protein